MLSIHNVKVYGLKESVIACRNAMRLEMPEYTDDEFNASFNRALALVDESEGLIRCHKNYLCGIIVQFDIVYPQYISPELQRYHFLDIITSSSKMHRLCKMDIKKACNKYVDQRQIEVEQEKVDNFNYIVKNKKLIVDGDMDVISYAIYGFVSCEPFKTLKGKELYDAMRYQAFMEMISNCPSGLELFMRVTTNYLQLSNIYVQRVDHRLKEDWGAFCKFIEELPYAEHLILPQKS